MSVLERLEDAVAGDPRLARIPDPAVVVIFGATGDLTRRKLVPALYSLATQQLLPPELCVVGVSRRDLSHDEFRAAMREAVKTHGHSDIDEALWEGFARRLSYVPGGFDDAEAYDRLRAHLETLDAERGARGNRLFYLSAAPEFFGPIARGIAGAGLNPREQTDSYVRLVIEKPFGVDLASARQLNDELEPLFPEESVYRIDHYLGKEAVQNLFVLRFANTIFEPLWNRQYVDHVQITVAENIGVGTRGGYYDTSGATRDILQNHALQVLSLVAMEPPSAFDADRIRDEKVKVLRAIPAIDAASPLHAVRARYTAGWHEGRQVAGYLDEQSVPPESITETYSALKVEVDNARWAGVPFFLRTGKRLPQRVTELTIQFSNVPHMPLPDGVRSTAEANRLIVRIQPDEGASLRFVSKVPGPRLDVRPVGMDFAYGNTFLRESPSAYERLLLDCLLGDPTLFARWDEVERAWEIVDPLLQEWSKGGTLAEYEAGTWGPPEAGALIGPEREWKPG